MSNISLNKIKEAIQNLEAIDPAGADAYKSAINLYRSIKNIPFVFANTSEPIIAFKTRTHDDDVLFENISEISLPPAYLVKKFGRCNMIYQPTFYCSDFRVTSYAELLEYWVEEKTANPIIYATIGRWRFMNPVRVLIVTSPNEEDRVSGYDKTNGKQLDEFINQLDGETKDAVILFYQFLFEKFRKPAKHDLRTYIITTAYCNLAIMSGQVDAIYYPSVPYGGKGVNLAFRMFFDFESKATLETVARDTFERDDSGDLPLFKQIDFREAIEVDYANKRIRW